MDAETGKINEGKLKENLDLALCAYISRVDGCPCGESQIRLLKGSNSDSYQKINSNLVVFLKGSKKNKRALQIEQPNLFDHFKKVWTVRNNHMVKGLPKSYIFYLKCWYQTGCPHPRC